MNIAMVQIILFGCTLPKLIEHLSQRLFSIDTETLTNEAGWMESSNRDGAYR